MSASIVFCCVLPELGSLGHTFNSETPDQGKLVDGAVFINFLSRPNLLEFQAMVRPAD